MKYRERMTSSLMIWRAAVTTVKQGSEPKKEKETKNLNLNP